VKVFINSVQNTSLRALTLKRSYVEPAEFRFRLADEHEQAPSIPPNAEVDLKDDSDNLRFSGTLIDVTPGGVLKEGVEYVARGRRQTLEDEPVLINGSSWYVWNPRGAHCSHKGVHDSPNNDGSKWTVGQIIIDILEHALGLPGGGSDIANHHGDSDDVTDTYLTSDTIDSYTAADILAIDTVIGEFSVSNTPVAQAIQYLLEAAGGFYGWYIQPDGTLRVLDLSGLSAVNVQAGQDGHWVDEGGTDYRLLSNELTWSLEGVYSRVAIQGSDKVVQVKPANLEGSGNPASNGGGEMEYVGLIDSKYVYRAEDQPYRLWTNKGVSTTPPEDWFLWVDGPRLYRGTAAGAKTVVNPSLWRVNLTTGMVQVFKDLALGGSESLWGWYYARQPHVEEKGPKGNAYDYYGLDRTLTIVDTAFRGPNAHPQGGVDDTTAMQLLAERMLEKVKNVRVQGAIRIDDIDWTNDDLEKRYAITNLSAAATSTETSTASDPFYWRGLDINAVELLTNVDENSSTITVANTFFLLEGYSALKERLKQNLFAERELALSEDIAECNVRRSSWMGGGVESRTGTGTETETGGLWMVQDVDEGLAVVMAVANEEGSVAQPEVAVRFNPFCRPFKGDRGTIVRRRDGAPTFAPLERPGLFQVRRVLTSLGKVGAVRVLNSAGATDTETETMYYAPMAVPERSSLGIDVEMWRQRFFFRPVITEAETALLGEIELAGHNVVRMAGTYNWSSTHPLASSDYDDVSPWVAGQVRQTMGRIYKFTAKKEFQADEALWVIGGTQHQASFKVRVSSEDTYYLSGIVDLYLIRETFSVATEMSWATFQALAKSQIVPAYANSGPSDTSPKADGGSYVAWAGAGTDGNRDNAFYQKMSVPEYDSKYEVHGVAFIPRAIETEPFTSGIVNHRLAADDPDSVRALWELP